MTLKSYPSGVDKNDWYNAVKNGLGIAPSGIVLSGDEFSDPTQVEFTPDLTSEQSDLYDSLYNKRVAKQSMASASASIQDLQAIAQANSEFIASLMSWLLNADIDQDDTATRYSNLLTLMSQQSTGVLNVFKSGLIAEEGIDVDSIGAVLLTTVQKRNVLRYTRQFANSWAIVVISS